MSQLIENIQAFFLGKKEDPKEIVVNDAPESFVPPSADNGELVVAGGLQSVGVDASGPKNDRELIEQYRTIARQPEVAEAIDEIANEMISCNEEGEVVALKLDNVELPETIKKKIHDEFREILELMDFEQRGHELVKRWYIDGRIAFHKVVNKSKMSAGIQELRYINPLSIEKVVEYATGTENGVSLYKTSKEYFRYTPGNKTNTLNLSANDRNNTGQSMQFTSNSFWSSNNGASLFGNNQVIMVSPDAIAYCTSGNYSEDFNSVTSFLHPAIKIANNLSLLEDALVIYRMTRAVERRVFYVDVGNLPKIKGDQYVNDLMAKFKTKIAYDSTTGAVKGSGRFQSMMEDFWVPRRDNGRATEITTLAGGQNLASMDDVEYFLKKMYSTLKVPYSRFSKEQPMMAGIGRSSEITRDEIRFQKFIDRLRGKFSMLFEDILGTQLVLKKVMTRAEWNEIKKDVQYDWAKDNFFTEMKETEMLRERLTTLQMADPYIGKFFTKDYVLTGILQVPDEELEELKKALDQEQEAADQDEMDDAIQQNDIEADKLDKTMAVQQKYEPEERNDN